MDVHEQRVSALQSELDMLTREKLAADKQIATMRQELSNKRAELTVRTPVLCSLYIELARQQAAGRFRQFLLALLMFYSPIGHVLVHKKQLFRGVRLRNTHVCFVHCDC